MGKKSKKSKSLQNKSSKKNSFLIKQKKEKQQEQIILKNRVLKSSKNFISSERKNKDKKIKLKALKYLFIQPNKNIKDMNIKELKEFAHKFDINADINYLLLLHLQKKEPKEFNKYIQKYKYTLHFKDAVKLKCFENDYIMNTLNEYNNNVKHIKSAKINSIENINSFSRLKIFNLLFFLLNINIDIIKDEDIEKKIISYSISETLIFKIPNKYGNTELKYYSYLIILANLFLRDIKNKNCYSNITIEDYNSSLNKGNFFNFKNQEKIEEEEFNLDEFYLRKKSLEDCLKEFNIKEEKKEEQISSTKKIGNNLGNSNKYKFLEKLNIIQIFKRNIEEIITLKDDNEIIQRINFIIRALLFYGEGDDRYLILILYSNCLKIDNNSKNGKYSNRLALKNLDYSFKQNLNNPFKCKPKYYLFPDLLTKNVIQNDIELYNSFKKLLKHIYNSKIIKDIYYLTPEFAEILYPFDDEEIFEELLEMTTFLPFPNNLLMGYAIKVLPEILISAEVTISESKSLFSEMICQLALILNTCIHEHLKQFMKVLIFYNSFQFGINKRINTNIFLIDEERKLIKDIFYKINNEQILIPLNDDEKTEIFLYGNTLSRIYFAQALELFKLSNWNKTIPQHIDNFINSKNINYESEYVTLEQIINDNDYCEFLKILSIKYNQFLNKENETDIMFDYSTFAEKNTRNITGKETNDKIIFDYSYHISFSRERRDTNF